MIATDENQQANANNVRSANGEQSSVPIINRVSVKVPPFWSENPEVWFAQIEAQFSIAGVHSDSSKFNTVVAAIESKVLSQIADAIINPPETGKYDNLKKQLLERFGASEAERMRQLLSELELADKKPSQLLNEMRHLGAKNISTQLLESLWLGRLPASVRAILQVSTEQLKEKALLADKIMEVGDFKSYVATANTSQAPNDINDRIERIEKSLEKINHQRNRSRTNSRSHSKSTGKREQSNSQPNQNSNWCWYHATFKNRAKNCRSPCSFNSNIQKN